MKYTMFAMGLTMFALAGTATANTPTRHVTASQVFKGNLGTQLALTDLSGAAISKARVAFNSFGRKDMVVSTKTALATVVDTVKKAYRSRKAMWSGYKVSGYAFINRRGTWMVTLDKEGVRHYVELGGSRAGTEMRIWGFTAKTPAHRR